MRTIPDFLIIGAQRAGTTSLYSYLTEHPRIASAKKKEVHFFDRRYTHGPRWYRRQFPWWLRLRPEVVTGEASPYYIFHPAVPQRVHDVCPDVKLIVLLRDPVDRAYSHYQLIRRRGREDLSFDEAIRAEPARLAGEEEKLLDPSYHSFNHQHLSYVSRGFYIDQILAWTRYFPLQRFLFLKSERFYEDPTTTLHKVFAFVGVQPIDLATYEVHQRGAYTDDMPPETRASLRDLYAPHNQRLYELLGTNFGW